VAFSRVLPVLLLVGAAVSAVSQQPTFRAQVNLVQVDVVATDASGRPV
jgi:hypothetical protein